MQNLDTINTTGLSLELFHVQTSVSFELLPNLPIIHIGKPNDQSPPDIDISGLPDADVVSRVHAQIQIDRSNYFVKDLGSSNGTFLNNTRLKPETPYQLTLGDRIDFGQGGRVTFIFQAQPQNFLPNLNPTTIEPEIIGNSKSTPVDRTTKVIGLALMVAGIVILTASVRVGIFFGIPGLLLCISGIFVLVQRRINPNLGWILIALGIVVIAFTGNVFASVNLFIIVATSVLFLAGYQLFTTGKIWNYDLRSLQGLIKK